MADNSPGRLSSASLVDPAIEASSLLQPSNARQSRHSGRSSSVETKTFVVVVSRRDKAASWGFLTYNKVFPLLVGEVTSDVAALLRKGDEIVEINKVAPKNYDHAIYLFQRARLHLELRIRRTVSQEKQEHLTRNYSVGTSDVVPHADAADEAMKNSASLPPTVNKSATDATLPPSHETPHVGLEVGASRYPAKISLEKLLRGGRKRRFGGGNADVVDGTLSRSPEHPSVAFNEDIEKVWGRVFSRKRARGCNIPAKGHRSEVGEVLPRPARQAIYDRRSCPFSAEEGFTSEFHDAVQHVLTANALTHGREGHSHGLAKGTVTTSPGSQHRDVETVVESIRSKELLRDEEVAKYNAAKGVAQCHKELEAVHNAMLRVAESHCLMREERRCNEVEKYRQTESAARIFWPTTWRRSHRANR
ncbi:hypothetical protein C3747_57g54 [Trypanosoma cruzi]|uniref:PDZ domain-containing protein n=1 Tax=Trypanosoma cruzi TaxID=5693 RepID=A0A2V2WT18_TRYCR|nr:hypothetical protein C3747_57g54 [Trypanosoma cruzi]